MILSRTLLSQLFVAGALSSVVACAFEDPDDGGALSQVNPSTPQGSNSAASTVGDGSPLQGEPTNNSGTPGATGSENGEPVLGGPAAPTMSGPPMDCGSDSQSANVKPVVLLFAFDVSASMGDGSQPCYDRTLKWEPVVAAAKQFFQDPSSTGLSASMTFFPGVNPNGEPNMGGFGGGDPALCQGDLYATPDVPVTTLPSPAFATALDAVTPAADAAWRLGTPTGPALEGTLTQIEALKAANPNNKYVIVLVTDGAPALCDTQTDSIQNVASIAQRAAMDDIPTYVIGVDNPATMTADAGTGMQPVPGGGGGGGFGNQCAPLANNLDALAQGGGTEALIIDTGNPSQTAMDFKAVIDSIRDENLNCEVDIPDPGGNRVFDKDKVNVSFVDAAMVQHDLVYDQTCTNPEAWRYDNADSPTSIQLCDNTCALVQADFMAQLNVAFGCETRIGIQG